MTEKTNCHTETSVSIVPTNHDCDSEKYEFRWVRVASFRLGQITGLLLILAGLGWGGVFISSKFIQKQSMINFVESLYVD